jgi:uncharacterized protein (UPF0264 family)
MVATQYALSVKQPWAALLVQGRKTIEVRRWPTARRGRILIHAARVPDERPEAWAHVPPELREMAQLLGGIVGAGDITDCWTYRTVEAFQADQERHLNDPSWFEPPLLYGFAFAGLRVLPFRPCPGWMRFFKMEWDEATTPLGVYPLNSPLPGTQGRGIGGEGLELPLTPAPLPRSTGGEGLTGRTRLLVSVRNAAEVEAALAGGADLIDVKEPTRGSLGAADGEVLAAVVAEVAGRRPVSAALGELLDSFWKQPAVVPHLAYAKWGLAGFQRHAPLLWRWQLTNAAQRLAEVNPGCRAVAVAYADWERAQAPPPEEVLALAVQLELGAFLIDTWHKDGSTLLDWLSRGEVERLCERCRAAGVPIALAGSLGLDEIGALRPLRPDWFAVRGAACQGRQREAAIEEKKVRDLVELLRG